MKKGRLISLLALVLSVGILCGVFLGRNVPRNAIYLEENTYAQSDTDTRLDINQATTAELMILPGIGEILAERIIAYRDQIGRFSTIDELLMVEGIGQTKLSQISHLIKAGG